MASQSELYSLAKSVGLSDSAAKTAAAIAMAESGGNPNAHNAKPPDDSYGLWQINMLGSLGPARRKSLGLSSNEQLFDPATNARAMKQISSNGTNFYPWSTFTNGSYLKYKDAAVTDESNNPGWLAKLGGVITSPVTAPMDAAQNLGSIVDTVNKTSAWISNSENWVRVGYVAGGAVLVVAGIVMVLQSTQVGRAVMGAIPAGKVAKVAKNLK